MLATLSACSNTAATTTETSTQSDQATVGEDQSGSVDIGDAEVSSDSKLPDGFPSDVPTLDATISGSTANTGTGWIVTYEPESMSVVTAFLDKFSAWTEESNFSADGAVLASYTNGTWDASIIGGEDAGTISVVYTITPAD